MATERISSMDRRPQSRPRGRLALVASMLAAIGLVTALAWWDEQREADAALADLAFEQNVMAVSLSANLRVHLADLRHEAEALADRPPAASSEPGDGRFVPFAVASAASAADERPGIDPSRVLVSVPLAGGRRADLGVLPRELLEGADDVQRSGTLVVFLAAPGEASLYTLDGRRLSSPAVRHAIEGGLSVVRLARPEAADLGLPARTALAGIASVDGPAGRWGVVTVASAARERDREKRAQARLVLSVVIVSGLVVAFGTAALRRQREELELSRRLGIAEAERKGDEKLARAERLATMGTFATGIAHEVSTPLGVIVGRTEQLLARVAGDEKGTRSARIILEQTDRIQNTVRRFLDMARGRAPSLERADPSEMARAAAKSVEHRLAKAHVSLAQDIPASMPAVSCDRELLEHALVNLLLNACEACPPGGHIDFAARSDAQTVAFVVADDGAGISAQNAARVTEPFFTTRPDNGGTGMGLAIVSEIAKSHRGRLTLGQNTPGGTRACLEIPTAERGATHAAAT